LDRPRPRTPYNFPPLGGVTCPACPQSEGIRPPACRVRPPAPRLALGGPLPLRFLYGTGPPEKPSAEICSCPAMLRERAAPGSGTGLLASATLSSALCKVDRSGGPAESRAALPAVPASGHR